MNYKALDGQSIYDVTALLYGDLGYVGKILVDNNLTLSSSLSGVNILYNETVKNIPAFKINPSPEENLNKTYKAKEGQSWYDLALMTDGKLEGLINLLYLNSKELANKINSGITIKYKDTKDALTQHLKAKNLTFNTGLYLDSGYVDSGYVDSGYVE